MSEDGYVIRWVCGTWGPPDLPGWPDDFPMPPSCRLDKGHDGPHRSSAYDLEWTS